MLAIDHRQNLRRALGADVADADLIEFELDVINALGRMSSSILVDPEYGAAQAIASGAVAGGHGMVVALEATGYVDDPAGRISQILDGWSVDQALHLGADAIKLLVYYHPEAGNARDQEHLVSEVADQCRKLDLPLFLEPLSFSLDAVPLGPDDFTEVVVETAHRLTAIGGDVLKAEFPSKSAEAQDWETPLRRLDGASAVPWVILSGGVSFDVFQTQVRASAVAGACGTMVGRAVWNEATGLRGEDRARFLRTEAAERLVKLTAVAGPGWQDRAPRMEMPTRTWFQ